MLRQHEHDLRAAKARRKVMCRRAEVSRTSGIHGTAAARFGGTIDQASSTECAQHIHPRPGSYAPEGQDRPSFAWSSTYFMSSSFVSVVNEPGQSTPALAPLLALRAVSDRQDFRPLRGGPPRPVTTRARGRSSGSVSRRSRASRAPASVRGARCSSSRPRGRGRDQDPRVEDER